MITFVLAECELELMPPQLARHPRVVSRARRRRRAPEHLLLDQAQDHEAMRQLDGADRRGRPDIAHVVSLLVQDSLLVRHGRARLWWHTRRDELVRVGPDVRLMRSQAKFYQLVEDLLRQGSVPLEKPLLELEPRRTLASIVDEAGGVRVLLEESGELARTADFTALARESESITLVLGGFPRGELASEMKPDLVLRVADEPLSAWSALVPALAGLEDAFL